MKTQVFSGIALAVATAAFAQANATSQSQTQRPATGTTSGQTVTLYGMRVRRRQRGAVHALERDHGSGWRLVLECVNNVRHVEHGQSGFVIGDKQLADCAGFEQQRKRDDRKRW